MNQHPKTDLAQLLDEAEKWILKKVPNDFKPEIALTLGSGLSDLSKNVRPVSVVPYGEIPGFVAPSISGHKGELIFGELHGKKVVLLSGRVHFYEGYSLSQITFPKRLIARLGLKTVILTSAVGAINEKYCPGDIVVVKDHINLMGANPLRGPHDESFGKRFPDMSECYAHSLQKLALSLAKKCKLRAHSGVYFAVSGPSYETPSEIRAFRMLGGDVVGMSVAPEAIVANQMKLKVLALSYISNMAAGVLKQSLSHHEVLEMGKIAGKRVALLIGEILKNI